MSLAIETSKVTAVLLADGWHEVDRDSFDLDSYEFTDGSRLLLGGGMCAGVPATGFSFNDRIGVTISGPLTSILALQHHYDEL